MEFSAKYKLIELLPGVGVQSYRAQQVDARRDVTVHLLVGGKTPENEALLVRLRAMQPQWLAEQDREAAAAKEFSKAGFWKRPDVGSLPAPPQPAKAPPPPAAAPPARE